MVSTTLRLTLACILILHHVQSFGIFVGRSSRIQLSQLHSTLYSGEDEDSVNRIQSSRSRISGNNRPPTAEELAVMDEMIDKLANAKIYELPDAVRRAFRVISSPQFFLRIAQLADQTSSEDEKAKLGTLASNLVATLETVVETTEEQLNERSQLVEKVVKAAAEPESGEFLVPLLPERVQAVKDTLKSLDESSLDEVFLTTVDSWMNKSNKDGMDLMVQIFQKVLQLYAALQVQRQLNRLNNDESSTAVALLNKLLDMETEQWDREIDLSTREGNELIELKVQIQTVMEKVVLSLNSGSIAQRVQAEFMQELSKRVDKIEALRSK